jgi:phosphoribosylanthranilate isomerase
MIHIKVCGIKEKEHALKAAEAGADFIGLVFAQSPRRVNIAQAQKIVQALKDAGAKTQTVGVFVNAPMASIKRTAEACQLDWVQLCGDEPWAYARELDIPVIKVIRISRHYTPQQISTDLKYGTKVLGDRKHIFLLDSNARFKYGGTGLTFDWNLAKKPAEQYPVIIAGGLTPDNVAEAIRVTAPWGVDASSGLESTRGVKDIDKILRFIKAARSADA